MVTFACRYLIYLIGVFVIYFVRLRNFIFLCGCKVNVVSDYSVKLWFAEHIWEKFSKFFTALDFISAVFICKSVLVCTCNCGYIHIPMYKFVEIVLLLNALFEGINNICPWHCDLWFIFWMVKEIGYTDFDSSLRTVILCSPCAVQISDGYVRQLFGGIRETAFICYVGLYNIYRILALFKLFCNTAIFHKLVPSNGTFHKRRNIIKNNIHYILRNRFFCSVFV